MNQIIKKETLELQMQVFKLNQGLLKQLVKIGMLKAQI